MQLWPQLADEDSQMEELQQKLLKAKAAAESVGSGALQRSGSGKGEILRSNFLLLLDAVMEQDSHLFSEEEHSVFETYRVGRLLHPIPLSRHRSKQASEPRCLAGESHLLSQPEGSCAGRAAEAADRKSSPCRGCQTRRRCCSCASFCGQAPGSS